MSSQPRKPAPAKSPAAHGSDRELRADARRNRERVLRIAQQLFATEGLGVSLDEIARRAGVGPGTVHRHFPAKEALYLAVATDQLEQVAAEAEMLATTDDPAALFTLLSRMIVTGAENAAVKSALAAAVVHTLMEHDINDPARLSGRGPGVQRNVSAESERVSCRRASVDSFPRTEIRTLHGTGRRPWSRPRTSSTAPMTRPWSGASPCPLEQTSAPPS